MFRIICYYVIALARLGIQTFMLIPLFIPAGPSPIAYLRFGMIHHNDRVHSISDSYVSLLAYQLDQQCFLVRSPFANTNSCVLTVILQGDLQLQVHKHYTRLVPSTASDHRSAICTGYRKDIYFTYG